MQWGIGTPKPRLLSTRSNEVVAFYNQNVNINEAFKLLSQNCPTAHPKPNFWLRHCVCQARFFNHQRIECQWGHLYCRRRSIPNRFFEIVHERLLYPMGMRLGAVTWLLNGNREIKEM